MPEQISHSDRASRVRWHCRRGMLELDVLLGNFFDHHYAALSSSEQELFIELLDCNDNELYTWLVKKEPSKPQFNAMIKKILLPGLSSAVIPRDDGR